MKKIILLVVGIVLYCVTPTFAKPKTLWLVGDATMAEYHSDSTLALGWGTVIAEHINDRIQVVNLAQTGMSAKVFIETGLLDKMETLRNRSYVLLQLGTNDLKEYNGITYSSTEALAQRINKIIKIARQNKINIILCTPLAQPFYLEGRLINRLGSYPDEIRYLAQYNHLPLLDLEQASRTWLEGLTEKEAAGYYITLDTNQLENGEYQLNEKGAKMIAEMAIQAIKENESKKLKKIIKK